MSTNNHILRNLRTLIRNSALTYMNEFVWQDVELTNEFQSAYKNYLEKTNYSVEFLGSTAVITSPYSKYIFVPNQWFVIASYAVDVYEELCRYKDYFKKVAELLHKKPDVLAKQLRDSATMTDQNNFISCAKSVFSGLSSDDEVVNEAAARLWRFVNDYSWWSGQKTIDRGDFFVSVILNMLNLVNVSQGYVADIVSAYGNDYHLRILVKDIASFTTNMDENIEHTARDYIIPDDKIANTTLRESGNEYEAIPSPERVKITIKGTSRLKEFKYKE